MDLAVAEPAEPQPAGLELVAGIVTTKAPLSMVLARNQMMKGKRLLTAAELAAVGLLGFAPQSSSLSRNTSGRYSKWMGSKNNHLPPQTNPWRSKASTIG